MNSICVVNSKAHGFHSYFLLDCDITTFGVFKLAGFIVQLTTSFLDVRMRPPLAHFEPAERVLWGVHRAHLSLQCPHHPCDCDAFLVAS